MLHRHRGGGGGGVMLDGHWWCGGQSRGFVVCGQSPVWHPGLTSRSGLLETKIEQFQLRSVVRDGEEDRVRPLSPPPVCAGWNVRYRYIEPLRVLMLSKI